MPTAQSQNLCLVLAYPLHKYFPGRTGRLSERLAVVFPASRTVPGRRRTSREASESSVGLPAGANRRVPDGAGVREGLRH
jgi:hypothetical protein